MFEVNQRLNACRGKVPNCPPKFNPGIARAGCVNAIEKMKLAIEKIKITIIKTANASFIFLIAIAKTAIAIAKIKITIEKTANVIAKIANAIPK
jgi:hypothetical protein